jgi:hypothetical protein
MFPDDEIPDESDIHKNYEFFHQERIRRKHDLWNITDPDPQNIRGTGREPGFQNNARFNTPSFRSQFFNVGEGLIAIPSGQTVILAKKTLAAQHSGVLRGFSQFFGSCDDMDGVKNSVTWGIRINGLPPIDFMDFVGEFSALSNPHSVYFPFYGGSTLGTTSMSVGGVSDSDIDLPTVTFQATNYYPTAVVLQGRLIGYTFPLAEREDEFGAI